MVQANWRPGCCREASCATVNVQGLGVRWVESIVPELLYPTAFDDPAWLFEPKYDGFRGLL